MPDVATLAAQLADLERQIADPLLATQGQKLKTLSREHAHKKRLWDLLVNLEKLQRQRAEAEALLTESNEELKVLAVEDLDRLATEETVVRAHLEELLLPHDPLDNRDVILEIRAGAGGEEAALFAAELFRAYARYAEQKGWNIHTLSTSFSEHGGLKEIIAELNGEGVFASFKYERGVHRVQRIPATEKQGRIHTSTVTVAVLPQAEEVDIVIRPEDLRIDTYRASGAGGQHVNKTSSAVRITHLPTNTVVAVQDERSQHKNRDKAMSILRARLLAAQEEARQASAAKERRQQIGTGDRSEKIRTYNFPQDRITDHRLKHSWSNIALFMEGGWDPIFTTMHETQRALALGKKQ